MTGRGPFIALGSRLKGNPHVLTLGVKPNYLDYTPQERNLIEHAPFILFPTLNYAQFFTTMGIRIFPSLETYLYSDEKIKQTTLYTMLGVPHPRTRVYFSRHHRDIVRDFPFPFVGKIPRCSSQGRGVFKICNHDELEEYLRRVSIAYIQEFLPHERDLRVVLVNFDPVISYWRIRKGDTFKTNIAQGADISFDGLPAEGVRLARSTAMKCNFNDVGMDLIEHDGTWHVIEANMKYGRKGLRVKGMDLKEILCGKLLNGEIP